MCLRVIPMRVRVRVCVCACAWECAYARVYNPVIWCAGGDVDHSERWHSPPATSRDHLGAHHHICARAHACAYMFVRALDSCWSFAMTHFLGVCMGVCMYAGI